MQTHLERSVQAEYRPAMQRVGWRRAGVPGSIDRWMSSLTMLPVDLNTSKVALMPCTSETHAVVYWRFEASASQQVTKPYFVHVHTGSPAQSCL